MSMLIDERRRQRQHSPTFDEQLTYGDTDQNHRHNVHVIPLLASRAPCGGSDRPLVACGRLRRSPCPCHRYRRASSAHTHPHTC
eukprot:scaffold38568_cov73-Phaeocystis_antarctica.AAC.1